MFLVSIPLFIEIFYVSAEMFSKWSDADVLYVGKGKTFLDYNKSAADNIEIMK